MKNLSFCITALLLFFSVFSISYAEDLLGITDNNINIEINPENPEPNQNVTIKLTSYAIDINKAMITWQNGSQIIMSGYGKNIYSFQTGDSGSSSIFDIKISPAEGSGDIIKRIAIVPSEVDVLWEAIDSYTPPFYKGKAFVGQEGTIRVTAIPNSKTITSGLGNISYTWVRNGDAMQNVSGYNKNSFSFINDILKDSEDIVVSVSSVKDNYSAKKKININLTNPQIIFYKKSPSMGTLYNNGYTKEMSVGDNETTLKAEPYFLSIKNRERDFIYNWQVNREKISTPKNKNELTIRPTSGGGYAEISLSIKSISKLFQNVANTIKLNL